MQLVPTSQIVSRLDQLGLSWADLVEDMTHSQHRQPMNGYATRQRWVGNKLQGYMEPGTFDGEQCFFVVGVRLRSFAEEPSQTQVVGIESKVVKRRKSGGAGQVWPTTWDELKKRIEAHDGLRVLQGNGGHQIVYKNGKQLDVLPTSSSDWRAIRNACLQLRGKGIDCRRVQRRPSSATA